MKISIVTPTFNSEKYLERAIKSVLCQTYKNIEYIIIDGQSKDKTIGIIKKYDKYINYWRSEPDKNNGEAIYKGFEKATGDIYAWLNSDEWYTEDTILESIIDKFNDGADLVYGNVNVVDPYGNILYTKYGEPFLPYLSNIGIRHGGFNIAQPGAFWKAELYKMVGKINYSFNFAIDTDLFCKYSKVTNKMVYIDRDIVNFTLHEQSKTIMEKDISQKDQEIIMRMYEKEYNKIVITGNKLLLWVYRIFYTIVKTRYRWLYYLLLRKIKGQKDQYYKYR